MNIIYCDLLYHNNIQQMNSRYLQLLTSFASVTLLCDHDYVNNDRNSVRIITDKHFKQTHGKVKTFVRLLANGIRILRIIHRENPDRVIVGAYETRTFALLSLLYGQVCNKLYMFENNNIDQLDKPYYKSRYFYKLFANKVNHIVFEKYMGDYLCDSIKLNSCQIYHVPHPFYEQLVNTTYDGYDCICISQSSDQRFLKAIIEAEETEKLFSKHKLRILIKSKEIAFDNGYVKTFNYSLPQCEYNRVFASCKNVLLAFPGTYRYRMSGNMMDAFSYHKPVIATEFMLAVEYNKKYPEIVSLIKDPHQLVDQLLKERDNITMTKAFTMVLKDHSDEVIKKSLKLMLE